jgi:3D-(3,5/4)-trihydroxycyclohexane-1,2-dione acylhydrolase (decyclizing)
MTRPTVRLTMAQALVRWLAAQKTELDGVEVPLVAGVWAIFGHGNVAGLGEALEAAGDALPTWRGQNEQSMAHAAVAYAKALGRRRLQAVTTSIGPGATNLVTAAAVAHVNRLPLLLLPGDVFASRLPDPVLQQVEDFADATVTANDCLRPVSRWFDRIVRPEQILTSLPQAIATLVDPASCGPVTMALPQDVQTEAYDYPVSFFAPRVHRVRRPLPDERELASAAELLARAEAPLLICGGGVAYSGAGEALADFARRHGIPIAETQAGKGVLPWSGELVVGGIGVTGTACANALAREADVVVAVGTRLADFTTASWSLFENERVQLVGVNVVPFDAGKRGAAPLVGDARESLVRLSAALADYRAPESWTGRARRLKADWDATVEAATAPREGLPSDAQVLGVVNRAAADAIVVGAAGGLPGELHKLWRVGAAGGYHLEYGYSCMGYEIAGGLGVKMAHPDRDVFVLLGDGSYLMMNSEIVTSVAAGHKLIVILTDNHGYGCIHRLQRATGGAPFGNLTAAVVDFAAHAASLGARSEKVPSLAELPAAIERARQAPVTSVIVIETDPDRGTAEGGAWWDVAVPEVSARPQVRAARDAYAGKKAGQRRGPS